MLTRHALATIAVVAAITLVATGCYQRVNGDQTEGVTSLAEDNATIPTATPILDLPAPVILSVETPEPASTEGAPPPEVPASDPVAAVTELEPAETPTPIPQPTVVPPESADPDGPEAFPFRSTDLLAAIDARGLDYQRADVRPGCDGRAAEVRHLDGPDGPPLSLWVYASPEDLKADWVLPSSGAPGPRFTGCEIDGGWIYWTENLVLAFEPQSEWIPEGAVREQIVAALWSLSR